MGGEAGKAAYCRRQGRSRADVRSDAHGHVRRPGYGRRRGLPGVGGLGVRGADTPVCSAETLDS
jgi:hypothetical protein